MKTATTGKDATTVQDVVHLIETAFLACGVVVTANPSPKQREAAYRMREELEELLDREQKGKRNGN